MKRRLQTQDNKTNTTTSKKTPTIATFQQIKRFSIFHFLTHLDRSGSQFPAE